MNSADINTNARPIFIAIPIGLIFALILRHFETPAQQRRGQVLKIYFCSKMHQISDGTGAKVNSEDLIPLILVASVRLILALSPPPGLSIWILR